MDTPKKIFGVNEMFNLVVKTTVNFANFKQVYLIQFILLDKVGRHVSFLIFTILKDIFILLFFVIMYGNLQNNFKKFLSK